MLLAGARVARVAADPAPVPQAGRPGGWDGLTYRRLHGSPKIYSSPYGAAFVQRTAAAMLAEAGSGRPCWCIFDNTMHGAALANAMQLAATLR